jgi:hypothetical protein
MYNMDSEDGFNDFVANELIDSLSSDGGEIFYFDATNIVANESLNEPCRGGSIVVHETVNRERISWHYLLYQNYFSDNPTFGPEYFRRR